MNSGRISTPLEERARPTSVRNAVDTLNAWYTQIIPGVWNQCAGVSPVKRVYLSRTFPYLLYTYMCVYHSQINEFRMYVAALDGIIVNEPLCVIMTFVSQDIAPHLYAALKVIDSMAAVDSKSRAPLFTEKARARIRLLKEMWIRWKERGGYSRIDISEDAWECASKEMWKTASHIRRTNPTNQIFARMNDFIMALIQDGVMDFVTRAVACQHIFIGMEHSHYRSTNNSLVFYTECVPWRGGFDSRGLRNILCIICARLEHEGVRTTPDTFSTMEYILARCGSAARQLTLMEVVNDSISQGSVRPIMEHYLPPPPNNSPAPPMTVVDGDRPGVVEETHLRPTDEPRVGIPDESAPAEDPWGFMAPQSPSPGGLASPLPYDQWVSPNDPWILNFVDTMQYE